MNRPYVPIKGSRAELSLRNYDARPDMMVGEMEGHEEKTLFELLGGETGLRALVDAFYEGMATNPAYAIIRALHPPALDGSRDKFFWFLCGWSGGPDHYIARFGHPRLRARHLPFAIGSIERDQWLACMLEALGRRQIEPTLQQRLMESFFQTADWMRNRSGDGPGS